MAFDIHSIGVGGQGIGMLNEILLRAADYAGWRVKAVDTHGLAQRGGIVVSQLRLGDDAHTPLVMNRRADLVIALERHEALRGLNSSGKDGGVLAWYDAIWQPLEVRIQEAEQVSTKTISDECARRRIKEFRFLNPDLKDARMQNIVLLAGLNKNGLLPKLTADHYRQAMADLMAGPILDKNMALFDAELLR